VLIGLVNVALWMGAQVLGIADQPLSVPAEAAPE